MTKRKLNATFNAGTKFALDWRDTHTEEWNGIIAAAVPDLLNKIEDLLAESTAQTAKKFTGKGLTVYNGIIEIALVQELMKQMIGIMECDAGMMLADGITKANIARAISMRPQNLLERYPDIENLADAQDKADETGEPQTVDIQKTNTVRIVYPVPKE